MATMPNNTPAISPAMIALRDPRTRVSAIPASRISTDTPQNDPVDKPVRVHRAALPGAETEHEQRRDDSCDGDPIAGAQTDPEDGDTK